MITSGDPPDYVLVILFATSPASQSTALDLPSLETLLLLSMPPQ
jgi:hypothetical protein